MFAGGFNPQASTDPVALDLSAFYKSDGYRKTMAHLRYGLSQGKGLTVITGEAGIGKTTIANYFVSTLNTENYEIFRVEASRSDTADFLPKIATGLNISCESLDKADLMYEIKIALTSDLRRKKRLLILVDNAQNLSVDIYEDILSLSTIYMSGHAVMLFFLLGRPELRATLTHRDLEPLCQQIVASYHISPLDEKETEEYIKYHFIKDHAGTAPSFDKAVFPLIYRATDGIPKQVNHLCGNILSHCRLKTMRYVSKQTVQSVLEILDGEIMQSLPIYSYERNEEGQSNAVQNLSRPAQRRSLRVTLEKPSAIRRNTGKDTHLPLREAPMKPETNRLSQLSDVTMCESERTLQKMESDPQLLKPKQVTPWDDVLEVVNAASPATLASLHNYYTLHGSMPSSAPRDLNLGGHIYDEMFRHKLAVVMREHFTPPR